MGEQSTRKVLWLVGVQNGEGVVNFAPGFPLLSGLHTNEPRACVAVPPLSVFCSVKDGGTAWVGGTSYYMPPEGLFCTTPGAVNLCSVWTRNNPAPVFFYMIHVSHPDGTTILLITVRRWLSHYGGLWTCFVYRGCGVV